MLYQTKTTFDALGSQGWVLLVQSNPVNTDTEVAIESVRIYGCLACVAWRFCGAERTSGEAAKFAREALEKERHSREKFQVAPCPNLLAVSLPSPAFIT